MKKTPALDFRDVSYSSVDDKRILDSVRWTVGQGEHWAILGPNGAGKTTLLRLACGYLWPNDGGVIYRKGESLIDLGELRKSIGWVTSTLASEIPRRENILRTVVSGKFAQIGLWDTPNKRDFTQAGQYLDQLGCSPLIGQEFGALSQGEQQKVLIARARMAKPYMIFLDEPCAGLDPGAREIFLAGLTKLGRQKKVPSLIYVTHHIEEILPLFRNMLVLREGRVLDSGKTEAILNPALLTKLYGVSLAITKKKGRYWPVAR